MIVDNKCTKSFSLKFQEKWAFHAYIEVVVYIVIKNEGLIHVPALLLFVDKDHTIVILYHEHIVLY